MHLHRIFLVLSLILWPCFALAQSGDLLAQFPSVQRVRSDIKGTDPLDTLARQAAALNLLGEAATEFIGKSPVPQKDLSALYRMYDAASKQVLGEGNAHFADDKCGFASRCPQGQWNYKEQDYVFSPAFQNEVIERYFTAPYADTFFKFAYSAKAARNMHGMASTVAAPNYRAMVLPGGIFLVVIAFIGMFWAGARSFRRTNEYGVQVFGSFFGMVGSQLIEGIVGLLSVVALIAGLLLAAAGLFGG